MHWQLSLCLLLKKVEGLISTLYLDLPHDWKEGIKKRAEPAPVPAVSGLADFEKVHPAEEVKILHNAALLNFNVMTEGQITIISFTIPNSRSFIRDINQIQLAGNNMAG